MPVIDSFERTARSARRLAGRLPLLEPVVDRVGVALWHRHLDRLSRRHHLTLPRRVDFDPRSVAAGLGELDGPVAVAFDRLGRSALVSGRRTVEKASAAGACTVAGDVVRRHPRWERIARRALAYAHQRGGTAYQPYLHPDLVAIPSDQGHERFSALLDALPARSGMLVDLGANSGYFSHRFEAAGFDCIAVERSRKEAYFLTAQRDALERRFRIIEGSLTESSLPPAVEVVLALNIFHHFLKSDTSFRALERFLGQLNARYLLFEAHLPDDPQMRKAPHDMAPDRFASFVAERAGMDSIAPLGAAADGRPLYLLSRDDGESGR